MKVSLQVHTPIIFNGKKGNNFIRENISRNPRYQEKTSKIVDLIKDKFNIKAGGADDILESLVDEIKFLTVCCAKAEKQIKDLSNENSRLEWLNRINCSELNEKEDKISSLKYKIHFFKI